MATGIYFITGVSGFVGNSIVQRLLGDKHKDYMMIVGQRRKTEQTGVAMNRGELQGVEYIEADITDFESCLSMFQEKNIYPDYIIHCAAPTKSAYMISNPVETIESIVVGTRNMLELAKRFQVKSMVYLSSMEVYGQIECAEERRIQENELGNIDIFNVRSCYPLGKRMAENLCYSYYKEYGVPVKIARLAQTFGKGVRLEDNRVYMQFARAVVEKKDIVLKTNGLSMGNYCAIDDVVNAIFILLQKGIDGEAYNIVNEANTMCIRDMAQLVADRIAGGNIKVKIELEDSTKTGYAPDTGLRLSGEKMRQLGWKPTKGLEEMYQDVIAELN